jgi:DNA polymerase III subunit alpha
MAGKFTHLHAHSHYSLLNALPKIPELVAAAREKEMDSLALTDDGNLYGAIEFYKTCTQAGIKPIIGIDAYVAERSRHDKEAGIDNKRSRLVLLAENDVGYKNLLKLVTAAHLEGFYYKPRVDHELLREHSKGLIAILPSFSGETTRALKTGDDKRAVELSTTYKDIFGNENVYFEITHHPEIGDHEKTQKQIIRLGEKTSTPLVAAHDMYYIARSDRTAREVMVRIQTGANMETGIDEIVEDFSMIDTNTAKKYFKNNPQALQNTAEIADRCNVKLELGKWIFPNLPISDNATYESELKHSVEAGLKKRGVKQTNDVAKRIDYELDIIGKKGFAPYFLVVNDLIAYAHQNGILTNIRGSVAGSMVTYLLGITNVNPLDYKLPFERFLNPDRPSAPDIDMDFADNRRDEVIAYARDKYGEDKVAQIGTFGTMMARGAVRDVARALGHPYSLGDRIAKMIPFGSQGFPMLIDKALEITPELRQLAKDNEEVKEVIDLAKKIEGCARHMGVHAAGVVISPLPLTEYVPLQLDPKGGKLITQYDMYSVSEEYGGVGLVKFDFLGITNLSILADVVERVEKIHDKKIDIENIPLDDKKVYEMLTRGETMGVFQMGSAGMTRFLKELKPSAIHDINAMIALYRPGPMQFIPLYIERKHNPRLISYLDPALQPILAQTYGVLVYQDDLLIMAHELAGYPWIEVDRFRKAVGKKIPKEMAAQREKFIEGCVKTSKWSREKAEQIWSWIEPFAAYGFNKAHSASYGQVAYQTAYMKANYPIEYMAALLTADSGDIEKISEIIPECNRMGISVLPPDINESYGFFTVVLESKKPVKKIRFGLNSIKNFGEGIAEVIIEERKKHGPYASLENFLERIQDRNLNKKSLESLVMSGALDRFGDRGTMMANLDELLQFNKEASEMSGHESLFSNMTLADPSLTLEKIGTSSEQDHLAWEKELLGLYISGHPLDKHREKLRRTGRDIKQIRDGYHEGMIAVISGIVEDRREILTKKGERMAFLRVADLENTMEVVVFPRVYQTYNTLLSPEKCIAVKGRVSDRNGERGLIAEAIKEL